ncbi:hypothetical protein ALC53_12546, partial [Atta colombica]
KFFELPNVLKTILDYIYVDNFSANYYCRICKEHKTVSKNKLFQLMHDLDEEVWKRTMTCVINILLSEQRNKPPLITNDRNQIKLAFLANEMRCFIRYLISKFERLNAVSINAYGIENKQILSLWPITRRRSTCIYNLLNRERVPFILYADLECVLLSGYDVHFIIKVIAIAYDGHVDVLYLKTDVLLLSYLIYDVNNLYRWTMLLRMYMENVCNHVDVKLITKWNDVYKNMKRDIARFDNGAIMAEFVGLRAKMYAMRVDGKKDTKKAKAIKNNVVARTITFDDYMRCLNEEMTRRQSCIRSKLHEVYIPRAIFESKIALSPYDDKRPDSMETLPWRHWRISNNICYYYVLLIVMYTFFHIYTKYY